MRNLICLTFALTPPFSFFAVAQASKVPVLVIAMNTEGRRFETSLEIISTKNGSCQNAPGGFMLIHTVVCDVGTRLDLRAALKGGGQLRLFKNEFVRASRQVIVIPLDSDADRVGPTPTRLLEVPKDLCKQTSVWLEFKKINSDEIDVRLSPSNECNVAFVRAIEGIYLAVAYKEGQPIGIATYRHSFVPPFASTALKFTIIRP